MTQEEIQKFKETIAKTIIPVVRNMTDEQIRNIISIVEKEHPELPRGFGNMLYEQIIVMKFGKKIN